MTQNIESIGVKNFKIEMANALKNLSICFSTEVQEMPKEQLKIMVEMIVRIIVANKMTFDFEPYSNAIRKIACGKFDVYRFNIVSLMKVFSEECELYAKLKTSNRCER